MRRIILTLVATAMLLGGGLFTNSTAEARPAYRYGGYRAPARYYRPAYRAAYRPYGYPGYYGRGAYIGGPRAGVYFRY